MKKFWIVLLSMGLLAAFSIPAFAIDVKFSGEYRVRGWYDNNPSGLEENAVTNAAEALWKASGGALGTNYKAEKSASFYDNRLRIQTDFVVAEGLTLTTRFDALEKKWGDKTYGFGRGGYPYTPATGADSSGRVVTAGAKEQENIEFERAYVTFKSAIGLWMVGYQQFMAFGPDPANSSTTRPGIKYVLPIGNLILIAAIEKGNESDVAGDIGQWREADQDIYDLGFVYKLGKMGDVGMMIQHARDESFKPFGTGVALAGLDNGFEMVFTTFDPYVRLNFGPVLIEAEGMYLDGELKWNNRAKMGAAALALPGYIGRAAAAGKDADLEEIAVFFHAKVDLAPVYFGIYAGYGSGDDIGTADEVEGGMGMALKAGSDFKPCLMMFNDDYATQFAGTNGVASLGSYLDNVKFGQLYVGVKPTPKLDVRASYSYAKADEATVANQNTKIGSEIDLTASYKIYDNLEYMLGAAYFKTGKYFKYGNAALDVEDDYMLMHKLTLKF